MSSNNSATVDRYLEAIYYIASEGEVVRPGRLATWLSVSAPTVSVALQRLQRDGWVRVKKDRSVALTAAGLAEASNLVRHHRILERWLTDGLGLDWATADDEADRLSSAISDFLIDRIDASLHRPLTCPHGNPIPGREAPYGELAPLADLRTGASAVIRRISELAEHDARDVLLMLAGHEIAEGSPVYVPDSEPDSREVSLIIAGKSVRLSTELARLIWVEVAA